MYILYDGYLFYAEHFRHLVSKNKIKNAGILYEVNDL